MGKNEAYEGREQTELKHRFLTEYLTAWGFKRGSAGRFGSVELYYVDCFAGPWSSGDEELSDTSVAISLSALNQVASEWSSLGTQIGVNALFVEKSAKAFERLVEFTEKKKGVVKVQRQQGEFGAHVDWIKEQLGKHDAFLFVECAFKYALDLAVPKPTSNRTYFRLVLGCGHEAAVDLFRSTERKILGDEAGIIRDAAKSRKKAERTGQAGFDFSASAGPDRLYATLNSRDQDRAVPILVETLERGERPYEDLWPKLLEQLHITKGQLNTLVYRAHRDGELEIVGLGKGKRSPDGHRVRALAPRAKHPPKIGTKFVAEDSPEKPDEPFLCPKCGRSHEPFCSR